MLGGEIMNLIKTASNNNLIVLTGCGCTTPKCGCITENKSKGTRTYTANTKDNSGGKNKN